MDTPRPACPLGSHCWGDSCPSPLHKDGMMADLGEGQPERRPAHRNDDTRRGGQYA